MPVKENECMKHGEEREFSISLQFALFTQKKIKSNPAEMMAAYPPKSHNVDDSVYVLFSYNFYVSPKVAELFYGGT